MTTTESSTIKVFSPEMLGVGEFDQGKITEIKPIDFPRGTGKGKPIGPLFYWAWASANGDGIIGMHPHKAFEIISYVIKGELGHSDSLENKTKVGEGGAQVIQAGSGIFHQEEMYGQRTEFFQIWFEPDLQKTVQDPPAYNQYSNDQFPVDNKDGTLIKHVIGNGSPVSLVAETLIDDVSIPQNQSYSRIVPENKCLAVTVIEGTGNVQVLNENHMILSQYFLDIRAKNEFEITFRPSGNKNLRIVAVEIPSSVEYPLYGGR